MKRRVAIVDGLRTPFCKAMGAYRHLQADDLAASLVRELIERLPIRPEEYTECIIGNVISPPHAYNVGRVISIKGGLPDSVPAITVSRNCASGMEAVVQGAERIERDQDAIILAGGVESMTHIPITISEPARDFLMKLSKAKGIGELLKQLFAFRFSFLKPVVPEINDPLCGLTMGETAENLAREYHVTRKEQDQFAFESQRRASEAKKRGLFREESIPVLIPGKEAVLEDDGIRQDQTFEQLEKLKPVFDRFAGTVTAGTSSQVTDGAAALVLMSEEEAKRRSLKPLAYLTEHAEVGVDPSRMGIGPAFAIKKLLKKMNRPLSDFDLIEINEAFAAQVLAVVKELSKESGELSLEKVNVNGGAIAIGHPLGASGTRLILTLAKELKRRGLKRGIASLCIGGGQGQAVAIEVE